MGTRKLSANQQDFSVYRVGMHGIAPAEIALLHKDIGHEKAERTENRRLNDDPLVSEGYCAPVTACRELD